MKSTNGRSFNKVFGIGMGKTGTTSLHRAFMRLNVSSIHHGPPDSQNLRELLDRSRVIAAQILDCKKQGEQLLTHIDNYEAYLDIGPIRHSFEILDKQYPDSRFIYTERDTESWLKSMVKHVERNQKNVKNGEYNTQLVDIDVDKWRNTKESHFEKVKAYFEGRKEDLLVMNVIEGDGYEVLCPFLGLPLLNEPFPKKNTASNSK